MKTLRIKQIAVVLVLVLALAGCTQQDRVIATLDSIEAGAIIAAAAHPDAATINVLQIVSLAVPQAITEEQSTDSGAQKAVVIGEAFASALAQSKLLSPQDQAIMAVTVAAITQLLSELQAVSATPVAAAQARTRGSSLTPKQERALDAVGAKNDKLVAALDNVGM